MRRALLRFAILCSLTLAGGSHAQTTRVVPLVVPTGETTSTSLEGHALLSLWLEKSDARIEVVTLTELLEPERSRERAEALEKGLAALKRAEGLRRSEGLQAAKEAYVEAAASLGRADFRRGFEALVTAQAWKAAATGEQQDAALLFTLRPDFTFPVGALDPSVEESLETARAGKAKAARTSFDLRSEVPALVWVDGVLVGMTPLRAPEVVAGRHFITALAPGYRLFQAEELVGPGSSVDISLEDTSGGPAVRVGLAELAAALRTKSKTPPTTLVELLKVPQVLVVGLSASGETAAMRFDGSGKVATAARTIPSGQLKSGLLALARDVWDAPFGVPARSEPVVQLPASLPPATTEQKPAASGGGIALVTVGAAAVLAGGVLFGLGQAEATSALEIPQVEDDSYQEAIAQAQLKVGLSYGLAGAGVASAIVGIVMLVSGPQTPAPPAAPEKDEFSLRLVPGFSSVNVVGRF